MQRLLRLSRKVTEMLIQDLGVNIERYKSGDFSDLSIEAGWEIPLSLEVDLSPLDNLDASGTPDAEIKNARLVWEALGKLRPSVACDEGIWTRLTHIECLEFTRNRWLSGVADDRLENVVRKHFFADGVTRRRDDNPISRAWWNAYIAEQIRPGTDLEALQYILKSADIRLNFIERSRTASRAKLAAGVVRVIESDKWLTDAEENFRKFMRVLNRDGGGVIFEALPESSINSIMNDCIVRAKAL